MGQAKIHTVLSSVLFAVALVIGASVAAPHRAAAQDYTAPDYGPWPALVVAVPPSLFVLGMTIADTVSFAEGKRFDDVLAVGDLVTGGLVASGSLIFLGVALNSAIQGWSTDPVPFGTVGAMGLALGANEIIHGVWSLDHARGPSGPSVAITPTRGGVELSLGGSF